MYKRILVPTDGSEITAKAVQTALGLAKTGGGDVIAIAVKEPFPYSALSEMQAVPPQEFFDTQDRIAEARLKAVSDAAAAAGVAVKTQAVEAVHPWQAIIDYATEQNADLIVMASHGRRGLSALMLGSETQRVLVHTKLPVLVVR